MRTMSHVSKGLRCWFAPRADCPIVLSDTAPGTIPPTCFRDELLTTIGLS